MSFLREGLSINKYHYYYLHSTWWYSVLKEDFFSLFLIMEILESASVSRYYNRRLQLLVRMILGDGSLFVIYYYY